MLEQIRNWNPKGNIKIKYAVDGGKSTWECKQADLLSTIVKVTKEYQEMDIKLTARQLYYQLVAADYIPNALEIYKRVSKFGTDARYGGAIDWSTIEDRGRVNAMHAEWDCIENLIDSALYAYRLPRWEGQKYHVELLCEKQALESVLKPVAEKWHIHFGYNKGYTSASSAYELSQRLKSELLDGKDVVVLYEGDHDPSGLDMVRDVRDRVTEFLTHGYNALDEDDVLDRFSVVPVALTKTQVERFNPPPNPAKWSDPRAQSYIDIHGEVSWELDAIEPLTLRKITEEHILKYLNKNKYDAVIAQEEEEKQALVDFSATL